MPTNLLNGDARLNNPLFKDANGNIPVIKSLNRMGNVVYQIPTYDAQIVYRILLYEVTGNDIDVYNRIIAHPSEYRMGVGRVRIERRSQTDWSNSTLLPDGSRPRKFTGLQFIVDVPNMGNWGRYRHYSTRTASVVNGKITLNAMKRVLREVNELLERHVAHETERQTRERIQREEYDRIYAQSANFMASIVEHFPIETNDSYGWRNNYTQLNLHLILDKHQIGKVFEAIHRIRNFQINPLDAEYLLKKDY